jgi:hypothetical protein
MKKWQNLAPPDDPGSWYDVDGVWPTNAGSYETCDFLSGTEYTATGTGGVAYAWTGQTLSSTREIVQAQATIWEYSAGTLTDRTGGVTFGTLMLVAYGDVLIGATGTSNSTIKSTGGNFSALAGAPNALVVCVQSNAVLLFNTNTAANGWAASDVGDYTNWSTGEYASGILYQTPGAITAAVAFGNDVIVFKANAIYRMRYVGGVVKWTVELLVNGIGCSEASAVCVGRNGILFHYQSETSTQKTVNPIAHFYWFDGVSYPKPVNPLTVLPPGGQFFITYSPRDDLFTVTNAKNSSPWNQTYFYCPTVDAWGKNTTPITNAQTAFTVPIVGDFAARPVAERSPQPVMWGKESANKLKRYSHGTPIGEIASACFAETTKIGTADAKSKYLRATPKLRRQVDLGADSSSCSVSYFRELHDTTASSTQTAAEDSKRHRFDFNAVDNFARVKVTYTARDVEFDDIAVKGVSSGQE